MSRGKGSVELSNKISKRRDRNVVFNSERKSKFVKIGGREVGNVYEDVGFVFDKTIKKMCKVGTVKEDGALMINETIDKYLKIWLLIIVVTNGIDTIVKHLNLELALLVVEKVENEEYNMFSEEWVQDFENVNKLFEVSHYKNEWDLGSFDPLFLRCGSEYFPAGSDVEFDDARQYGDDKI